ncbi:hypothetical protein ACJX0J_030617, partial [Zea mays]
GMYENRKNILFSHAVRTDHEIARGATGILTVLLYIALTSITELSTQDAQTDHVLILLLACFRVHDSLDIGWKDALLISLEHSSCTSQTIVLCYLQSGPFPTRQAQILTRAINS